MKKNKDRNAKEKRPPGRFVALPYIAVCSQEWIALSPFAVKLLLDLLAQYNGRNNGDLTTAWGVMRKRGWASNDSLYKALRELESRGWIQRTRQGGRHVATLWALTMYALDDDNPTVKAKLDILPRDFDRGAWTRGRIARAGVPVDGVSCKPPTVLMVDGLSRQPDQLNAPSEPIKPPAVSVEPVLPDSLSRRPDTFLELPSLVRDLYRPSPSAGIVIGLDPDLQLPARPESKSPTVAKSENEFDRARRRWQQRQARSLRRAGG